jgi:hypothetical protein
MFFCIISGSGPEPPFARIQALASSFSSGLQAMLRSCHYPYGSRISFTDTWMCPRSISPGSSSSSSNAHPRNAGATKTASYLTMTDRSGFHVKPKVFTLGSNSGGMVPTLSGHQQTIAYTVYGKRGMMPRCRLLRNRALDAVHARRRDREPLLAEHGRTGNPVRISPACSGKDRGVNKARPLDGLIGGMCRVQLGRELEDGADDRALREVVQTGTVI